jgi:hypothetical protein
MRRTSDKMTSLPVPVHSAPPRRGQSARAQRAHWCGLCGRARWRPGSGARMGEAAAKGRRWLPRHLRVIPATGSPPCGATKHRLPWPHPPSHHAPDGTESAVLVAYDNARGGVVAAVGNRYRVPRVYRGPHPLGVTPAGTSRMPRGGTARQRGTSHHHAPEVRQERIPARVRKRQ